jgi:hypothetical protein
MTEELAIAQAITQMWYNGEVGLYPSSSYGQANPDFSNFEGWGHYSQMVWVGSTQVGCAAQYCPAGTMEPSMAAWYSVCNYYPAGMSRSFLLFIGAYKLTRHRKRGWRVRRQRLGAWKWRHCHRGYLCVSLAVFSLRTGGYQFFCFVWCMGLYTRHVPGAEQRAIEILSSSRQQRRTF